MEKLLQNIKGSLRGFVDHWKTPKEGNEVPNKEVVLMCVGASGTEGASNIMSYISFAASSFLVGAVYGISFNDIYIISIIDMIFGLLFSPLSMAISDNYGRPPRKTMILILSVAAACVPLGIGSLFIPENLTTNILASFPQVLAVTFFFSAFNLFYQMMQYRVFSKKFGKFRTLVLVGCFPTILCIVLMGFLPIGTWKYGTRLWVLKLLFSFYGNFASFNGQRANIMNLMTTNSDELAKIRTWVTFVAGAVGGLFMIALPFIADFFGGMNSLAAYRYIIPIGLVLCLPMVLVQVFGVKERVIISEEHRSHTSIGMMKGFKEVLKNKYFWIIKISGFLNSISTGMITILHVMVVYALRQDYILGVLIGVAGCFATVALPFVPKALRKFGNRTTLIVSSFLQIISYGIQVIGIFTNSIAVLFIGLGSINFFNIFTCMAADMMLPQAWDYQQYISGERLENSAGIFDVFLNPLTRLTGLIVPAIYAVVGFTSDWNILYFDDVRNKVFLYTVLLMVSARILVTIPYFFFDLNEGKHREIVKVLHERVEQEKNDEATPEAERVAE